MIPNTRNVTIPEEEAGKRQTDSTELSSRQSFEPGSRGAEPPHKTMIRKSVDYTLFLYTMMPPMKITSITTANIKKVLSMVAPFVRTRHATKW